MSFKHCHAWFLKNQERSSFSQSLQDEGQATVFWTDIPSGNQTWQWKIHHL